MTASAEGWDWWSEVKLQILAEYLGGFTKAVRGLSSEAICLDLFAGATASGSDTPQPLPQAA